jgi:hypothetical protein
MRPGPTRLDKNSLKQPTCRGRIDHPLSFWAQWFSKRQVPLVFTPWLAACLVAAASSAYFWLLSRLDSAGLLWWLVAIPGLLLQLWLVM